MVSAHSGWLSKTQSLWNWLQTKPLIPVSRHNLISPFRVIIMSSQHSAFPSFLFFWLRINRALFPGMAAYLSKEREDGVWGILPHNTLINRLLIATIYINEERFPLVRIPKYPTTLLNLHQPTSVRNFFFIILMVKYVTVLVNTPKPSVGLWGRRLLRTISGVYSVSSVHPVVRRKTFCALFVWLLRTIFIIPFPSHIFFSNLTPSSSSIFRWVNKKSPGACHTPSVGCSEWLSEILKRRALWRKNVMGESWSQGGWGGIRLQTAQPCWWVLLAGWMWPSQSRQAWRLNGSRTCSLSAIGSSVSCLTADFTWLSDKLGWTRIFQGPCSEKWPSQSSCNWSIFRATGSLVQWTRG